MRLALSCALFALAATAHAEVAGVIDAGNGGVINLHKEAGDCVEGAKRAEYVGTAPARVVEGCWRVAVGQPVLSVGWRNGRVDVIPVAAVRPPKAL